MAGDKVFQRGAFSVEFDNSFLAEIARERFMKLLNVDLMPKPTDTKFELYTRSFVVLAAHSMKVRGLAEELGSAEPFEWQPPDAFDDEGIIRANAQYFFKHVGKHIHSDLMAEWMLHLNTFLFGKTAVAPAEQQGTGTDEDFLAQAANDSSSTTSTSPQRKPVSLPATSMTRKKSGGKRKRR